MLIQRLKKCWIENPSLLTCEKSKQFKTPLMASYWIVLIWMSHCCPWVTEGAEFWISCKQLPFLSNFSHLQLIQNSAPFVTRRRQCDIRISVKLGWIFQSNILEVIGLPHYSKINLALLYGLYLSLNPFLVEVLSVWKLRKITLPEEILSLSTS